MDRWIKEPYPWSTDCYNCKHHRYEKVEAVMKVRDTGYDIGCDVQGLFILYPNGAHCAKYGNLRNASYCKSYISTK